jgi:hypothetical protein
MVMHSNYALFKAFIMLCVPVYTPRHFWNANWNNQWNNQWMSIWNFWTESDFSLSVVAEF